jgi:hypothetical protein
MITFGEYRTIMKGKIFKTPELTWRDWKKIKRDLKLRLGVLAKGQNGHIYDASESGGYRSAD